ncbi:MAG: dimethyl sulfoxide reductase anchor subunit family protein [Acidobacteriaceae bacterium]
MDKNEEYRSLVAFTTLAPLSVGGLAGLLVVDNSAGREGIDLAAVVLLAVGILALGFSLLHLGRPWRAPLALFNPATSWLSREVILFAAFLVLLALYSFLPLISPGNPVRLLMGILAATLGFAGTIASGEIYRLHSRPPWDSWLSVSSFPLGALSAGLLFGYSLACLLDGSQEITPLAWAMAAIFLVMSLAVSLLRSTRARPGAPEVVQSRQLALGAFRWLLIARGIGVIAALIFIALRGETAFYAWVPAIIGELADRTLFFKTVIPVTLRGRYI